MARPPPDRHSGTEVPPKHNAVYTSTADGLSRIQLRVIQIVTCGNMIGVSMTTREGPLITTHKAPPMAVT